jgi:DNA-binding transcriptional regulator GbsR (MarR family)
MADNIQVVLDAMIAAGKPLKGGEIVELSGLEKKDVDKVMKELKKDELIVSPKRCYWEVK